MAARKAPSAVTIALIQTQISEDIDLNLKRAPELSGGCRQRRSNRLPARALSYPPFSQRDLETHKMHPWHLELAERIPGPSTEAFHSLARELQIVIIVPIFEKDISGYYNSAAVIDADGTLLPTYRKVHIPHDHLFYERSYFDPGEEIRVYNTRYARFATLICFDQWFPEAACVAALDGAQISSIPRP